MAMFQWQQSFILLISPTMALYHIEKHGNTNSSSETSGRKDPLTSVPLKASCYASPIKALKATNKQWISSYIRSMQKYFCSLYNIWLDWAFRQLNIENLKYNSKET